VFLTQGALVKFRNGLNLKAAVDVSLQKDAISAVLPRLPDWRFTLGLTWRTALTLGDSDHDGVADKNDKCPQQPEDFDGFQDEDGCPDLDNDGDGIPDRDDLAPDLPEDKDGFQDEDGRPDLDNDGDGIRDADDGCPNEPEDFDGDRDTDGCPDVEKSAPQPEDKPGKPSSEPSPGAQTPAPPKPSATETPNKRPGESATGLPRHGAPRLRFFLPWP
jgi:hypothetical protein